MPDKFSKQTRSKIMSKIRSSKTKPELILKEKLKGLYLTYQPKMYGNPDFANKKRKIAIFVDGCFWHKCSKCYKLPKSNVEFWKEKVNRNMIRAETVNKKLRREGWTVLRFWEHTVMKKPDNCVKVVIRKLKNIRTQ